MSAYVKSPFRQPPTLLYPGFPAYLWGSFNDKTGPTLGTILADSGNGAISSVKFLITSGNVPLAGSSVTIVGTANASGNYNGTFTILTVSAAAQPDAGVYTLTFTGTANSGAASDGGQLSIPQPEVGEALVSTTASVPASMPYGNSTYNQNQGLTAVVSFPSLPTSVVVSLVPSGRSTTLMIVLMSFLTTSFMTSTFLYWTWGK